MRRIFLNLDKEFCPLNGEEIRFDGFNFSGGEPHIKIDPNFDRSIPITITHRLKTFNDFGLFCLAVDALKRMNCTIEKVFIPYFPAARQDRVMVAGEPLSLKVFADIINAMHLRSVVVYDAHSEVTPAVLNNCEVISNHRFVEYIITDIGSDILLVAPDAGAMKKIYKLSEFLGGKEIVECGKKRDIHSGDLKSFKVFEDDLRGRPCLIVDDICDGGGTFIGLAVELKKKNAGKLYLAVSHGIFNKGFADFDCFERIYTTDSFKDINDHRVRQIKLAQLNLAI